MPDLILASSSRYRAELLSRLGLPFTQRRPDVDETPIAGEAAPALVERLGVAKAEAVARAVVGDAIVSDGPNPIAAIVIASDQVCDRGGDILGKPGDAATAQRQLATLSGQTVVFHTSLVVLNTTTGLMSRHVDQTTVTFRDLSASEIAAYVDREQPFDCAGAFKSEGLGVALFERIDNRDPNALIGLPLIALCRLLREQGINPLSV